jgi:hypothetical protein
LGSVLIVTYVPVLNTAENLAILLSQISRVSEAKELYLCAQRGIETVFGYSSRRCQDIALALAGLGIDGQGAEVGTRGSGSTREILSYRVCRETKAMKCARCKVVAYCGKEYQKED